MPSDPPAGADGLPARARIQRLPRQLRLIDVYAISTGAMFSSGFFLLPGLASAEAGPAVALAYLLAGLLIIPAMLSAAELSTAMPRAGGPYYFLDRSIGPLFGTIAGTGTWVGLVFKSTFALVGMSAYIAIFADLPIQPVAVGLTLVFMGLNILGAKKTSGLQVALVSVLLAVLGYFVAAGLLHLGGAGLSVTIREQFTPFLPFGLEGIVATTGLVFVSYAGLTQVASVSEEVERPDRNIPLGMILSLVTATVIYVVGVLIMVAVLDPGELREDLTPVASAAEVFLPTRIGLFAVVAAAVAAFASTGNAGILAAARYPLAMSRDRLVWRRLSRLGRFGTPTTAILLTGATMIACILLLDVRAIAALASAFMLLIFGLMNLAVIVMRESRIEAYDPDFRSPAYPWVQLAGIAVTIVLVREIGPLSALFTSGLAAACIAWYFLYARSRVERDGAIYHIFERLGRRRDAGLDRELMGLLAEQSEQGVRDEDRFEEVVARAAVIELPPGSSYRLAVDRAAGRLADRLATDAEALARRFHEDVPMAVTPVSRGAALPYILLSDVEHPEMVVVRSQNGLVPEDGGLILYALLFLVGDRKRAGQAMRILAQLTAHADRESFLRAWNVARNEQELKEVLLADDRYLSLLVGDGDAPGFAGSALRDLALPEGVLVALIRRNGRTIVPRGSTVLRHGDRLTVIGDPDALRETESRYGRP